MRSRFALLLATLLSMTAAAAPRGVKDSVVVSGRLYPSGDFTAVVTAEVRRADIPLDDRAVTTGKEEGNRMLAEALAKLQMGSYAFHVEPIDGAIGSALTAGVAKLRYKLTVRPWIVPGVETVERPLPSVLPGLVADTAHGPLTVDETTTIDIDDAYDIVVPDDKLIKTSFAEYRSDYDLTDGRLSIRRTLTLLPGHIAAARRDEAAAFVQAVGDDVGTKVAIRRLLGPTPVQRMEPSRAVVATLFRRP